MAEDRAGSTLRKRPALDQALHVEKASRRSWRSPTRPPRNTKPSQRDRSESTGRVSTVFDAVAGRVAANNRYLSTTPLTSKYRDTLTTSRLAVPPDEVLFRRKNAPIRYEENDFYWADKQLRPDQQLPDSDLLKAIHLYVSDFYTCATENKGDSDVKSLDETALLCMGILLEETAKEALGETGDLAFTEAHDEHEKYVHGFGNERNVITRGSEAISLAMKRRWKERRHEVQEEMDRAAISDAARSGTEQQMTSGDAYDEDNAYDEGGAYGEEDNYEEDAYNEGIANGIGDVYGVEQSQRHKSDRWETAKTSDQREEESGYSEDEEEDEEEEEEKEEEEEEKNVSDNG